MPILHSDRLVGKLDAAADRKADLLRVDAIHQDVPFGKTASAAVREEIRDLGAARISKRHRFARRPPLNHDHLPHRTGP